MNSPSREYDPEDRPRFNEWVRVDAVRPVATNRRASEAERAQPDNYRDNGADNHKGRTSGGMRVLPALFFCLVIGLAGGFFIGRGFANQYGLNPTHQDDAAGRDAAAARMLEKKIKTAIAADPMLGDKSKQTNVEVKIVDELEYLPGNMVNKSRKVLLTGGVISREAKDLVTQVAQGAVNAAKSDAKVVNKLHLVSSRTPDGDRT